MRKNVYIKCEYDVYEELLRLVDADNLVKPAIKYDGQFYYLTWDWLEKSIVETIAKRLKVFKKEKSGVYGYGYLLVAANRRHRLKIEGNGIIPYDAVRSPEDAKDL